MEGSSPMKSADSQLALDHRRRGLYRFKPRGAAARPARNASSHLRQPVTRRVVAQSGLAAGIAGQRAGSRSSRAMSAMQRQYAKPCVACRRSTTLQRRSPSRLPSTIPARTSRSTRPAPSTCWKRLAAPDATRSSSTPPPTRCMARLNHCRSRSKAPAIARTTPRSKASPSPKPLDFHSPYGCSKGAADQYVRDYARIYDLPTVVFRMSCIAGPRQFGNEDQGWVAHFLYSVLAGRANHHLRQWLSGSRRAARPRPAGCHAGGPRLQSHARAVRSTTSAAA